MKSFKDFLNENLDEGNWIAKAVKKPGAEKAAAKKAGMSTHEYMEKHKHDSGKAGKRARLGLTLSKLSKESVEAAGDGKVAPQSFNHLKKEPLNPGHVGKQEKDPLDCPAEHEAGRDAQKAHGKEAEAIKDKKTLSKIGLSPRNLKS